MGFEAQWYIALGYGFVFEVHFSISQKTVPCVSWFLKPGCHGRSIHVWRVRWSVPWSFSPRKAFVALGYGVVFVAHRKISFVSCMVGLPIVCSIWCFVWLCTFLGSRAVFIRCVLFEWIGVGVVLSPLHVKIGSGRTGSGRTDGKDCVVNVFGIFIATVAMLVFKGLFRAWSFFLYILGLWETDTNLYWHCLSILWSG